MNKRRKLIIALGACALTATSNTFAQPAKIPRIGFLGTVSAAGYAKQLEAFRTGLRDFGYVEGKTIAIEYRWADGKYERLSELARELIALKVDLIVTHSSSGARAAKQSTLTIPVVFVSVGDPIASGVVTSLARPGGNVTGLSHFIVELNGKRLELLKETFPRIRRVGVLMNPRSTGMSMRGLEVAAKSLKLELQPFKVVQPSEFEDIFSAMGKAHIEAVAIYDDPMLIANVGTLGNLAVKHQIPVLKYFALERARFSR